MLVLINVYIYYTKRDEIMCCYVNAELTQEYKDKIKRSKKGKMVTVWKILYMSKGKLRSPYYHQVFTEGWNFSNRKSLQIPHNAIGVNKGIHVYLKKGKRNLIKCKANINDFVGCSDTTGVFLKIFISPKEYKNAFQNRS